MQVSAVTRPRELVVDKGYDASQLHPFFAGRGSVAFTPRASSRKRRAAGRQP